jgi:cation:H+ antiporter
MLTHILIIVAALVVLGVSAHFLVHSSVRIAKLFNVSEIWIGLTIVAMGTSAPEIAVSVSAALKGQGALSVGNVIGSNIFNLGFILGVVSIIAPQKIAKKMLYRDMTVLLISTAVITLMLLNQFISLLEGGILLALLVAYNVFLWVKKDLPHEDEVEDEKKGKWYDFIILLVSLYILVTAADYAVESAVFIAESYGISEWAIGATIVAAGTSLPEIATSVIATLKGKFGLSVGNVVGSDIFNSLGIIGISAVVAPLNVESGNTIAGMPDNIFSMVLLVATIFIIGIMMRTGWKISRLEGSLLLTIAIARMGFEIYLGSGV